MRMLQRLPKLMRFIPGTAQDVRAYFLALQYWLAGSEENLANMVRMLVGRYAHAGKAALFDLQKSRRRSTTPMSGCITRARRAHRVAAPTSFPPGAARGTVGLLLLRSYLLAGNAAHYDGVIAALERARAARAARLCQRARPAAGDRGAFHPRRRAVGRRGGVADRILAGRRPRLQRPRGGRGAAGAARRALHHRPSGRVPDARAVGGRSARPAAGGGHHDGGDPRARRRHRADDVRRTLRSRAERRCAGCDGIKCRAT